jgi:sec-independent protein translocase protein TatC
MATSEKEMGLFEHVSELRQRLLRAVVVWVALTVAASFFTERIVAWLVQPLGDSMIIVLSPTEAPIIYYKIALLMGFVLSLPHTVYQIYAFIAPGLYPQERGVVLAGIPSVLVLFTLGAMFTVRVMIPISLPVLMGFLGSVVSPTYTLEKYVSFVSTLVTWMGLLFQTPLVIYVIARLGFVTPKQLSGGRKLVIFVAALVAAVVTPTTDPVTMLMATGPFIVLYEVGILLSRLAVRQRERAQAESEAMLDEMAGIE